MRVLKTQAFIAALKRLRHPKSELSETSELVPFPFGF
jgi:hypothetical protein